MAEETDFQLQHAAKAIDYGLECVRAGILVNGGAIVAILGFIGASDVVQNTDLIRKALSAFSQGLASSLVASVFGYFTHKSFSTYHEKRSEKKKASDNFAKSLAFAGLCAACASFYLFSHGVAEAGRALFP